MIFIDRDRQKLAETERGVASAWFSPYHPSKLFGVLIIANTNRGSCFTEDGNPNVYPGISSGPPDPSPRKEFGLYTNSILN